MKKLLFATLVVAMIGTSAFAADGNKLNYKVASNFRSLYAGAKNVQWSLTDNYTKASFQLNGETLEAFYALDGEAIGVSKKVDIKTLPASAIAKIRKSYSGYEVKEVILFTQEDNSKYYVSLSNSAKTQILEVSLGGSVSTYNK